MSKTIVWIEDDADSIEAVIRPLERAGYRFVNFYSVAESLNNIERIRDADLVLLDMILPPGNTSKQFGRYPGLDLLKELRIIHRIDVPVVAFTVVTREEVRIQLKELDVISVIRKPARPSELKEQVESALEGVKSLHIASVIS